MPGAGQKHLRSIVLAAAALLAGLSAAGCAQVQTALPDPATLPSRAMVAEERSRLSKSMQDLQKTAPARGAQAVRAIETKP